LAWEDIRGTFGILAGGGRVKPKRGSFGAPNVGIFEVSCKTEPTGAFRAGADSLAVTVGQRVRVGGSEEMWDSVGVYAQEEEDGSLVVRILVFNPDWDEALQIACIRSRPGDVAALTALGCNLDHVAHAEAAPNVLLPDRARVSRSI
jgi:hypothetical protein